jgi:hypothetical protein
LKKLTTGIRPWCTTILLFVRDRKRSQLGAMPFTFLGTAEYVSIKASDRSTSIGA